MLTYPLLVGIISPFLWTQRNTRTIKWGKCFKQQQKAPEEFLLWKEPIASLQHFWMNMLLVYVIKEGNTCSKQANINIFFFAQSQYWLACTIVFLVQDLHGLNMNNVSSKRHGNFSKENPLNKRAIRKAQHFQKVKVRLLNPACIMESNVIYVSSSPFLSVAFVSVAVFLGGKLLMKENSRLREELKRYN